MSLRIGPGPPGVLAAVAAGDPKSGVLASSSSPLLHTGSTEIKEGGRKNATAVRRLRRRRPMKEMLTARKEDDAAWKSRSSFGDQYRDNHGHNNGAAEFAMQYHF